MAVYGRHALSVGFRMVLALRDENRSLSPPAGISLYNCLWYIQGCETVQRPMVTTLTISPAARLEPVPRRLSRSILGRQQPRVASFRGLAYFFNADGCTPPQLRPLCPCPKACERAETGTGIVDNRVPTSRCARPGLSRLVTE